MKEIVNKVLLADDIFMLERHLKQPTPLGEPGFTYSACGNFSKSKKIIEKFKETGDTKYIYKNELDEACFQHDMVYGDLEDLARRTASDNILRDKAFNIAKNPKHDGYQIGFASMACKFFDKKSAGSGVNTYANNEKLARELHKPFIKKRKKEQFVLDLKAIFGVLI